MRLFQVLFLILHPVMLFFYAVGLGVVLWWGSGWPWWLALITAFFANRVAAYAAAAVLALYMTAHSEEFSE